MSSLTEFRQAIQDALQAAYKFTFVAGDLPGPAPESDAGCVWARGKREFGDDVMVEEVLLGVRVFAQWKQRGGVTSGPNEEELEKALETLQTTLRAIRTTAGPWMFRVTEVEIDRSQSAVEATLLAYQANLAGG